MTSRIIVDKFDMLTCAMCKEELKLVCLVCKTNNVPNCPTIQGRCGHVYHKCCIDHFTKHRYVCPLDNREWKVGRQRSPKTLIQICHRNIGFSILLTLEAIMAGPTVITDADWTGIHGIINKQKHLYSFGRPENMSIEALRVFQIQFKTPSVCELEHVQVQK